MLLSYKPLINITYAIFKNLNRPRKYLGNGLQLDVISVSLHFALAPEIDVEVLGEELREVVAIFGLKANELSQMYDILIKSVKMLTI
jgi:hypothetical protein